MSKEQIPVYLALLRDPTADDELKIGACWTIYALSRNVDRRRVVPAVIRLLDSPNEQLRRVAALILGQLDSKPAVDPLLKICANKAEALDMRTEAIRALSYPDDPRVCDQFQQIMFDEGEVVEVRSMAVEWYPSHEDSTLELWIRLLDDPLADLRFWAAFRLASHWIDSSAALPALDRVAAHDHTIPDYWGWHVDREALAGLEQIYSLPYRQRRYTERDDDYLPNYGMYLISPTLEYFDFAHVHRRWNEGSTDETPPEAPVDFRLEPEWLKAQIAAAWQGAAFDVRQPKPQTYLLDWYIEIDGYDLLGGLHRDQYAIVLTGKAEAVYPFAAWVRSIITPQQKLFLYGWADPGTELTPGVSANGIARTTQATLDKWTIKPPQFT